MGRASLGLLQIIIMNKTIITNARNMGIAVLYRTNELHMKYLTDFGLSNVCMGSQAGRTTSIGYSTEGPNTLCDKDLKH